MAAKKPTKMKARRTTGKAKATKKATPRGIRSATRVDIAGAPEFAKRFETLRVPGADLAGTKLTTI